MAYIVLAVGTIELCECGDKYEISHDARKSLPLDLQECVLKKSIIDDNLKGIEFVNKDGKKTEKVVIITNMVEKIDFPFDFESYTCPVDD